MSTYACPRNRNLNKIIAIAGQVGFPPDLNRSQIYRCLLSHTNPKVQVTIPSGLGDCLPSGLCPVGSNLPPLCAPDGRQPVLAAVLVHSGLQPFGVFIVLRIKARTARDLTPRGRPLSLPHLLVPACPRRGGPSFPLPGRFTLLHPFCLPPDLSGWSLPQGSPPWLGQALLPFIQPRITVGLSGSLFTSAYSAVTLLTCLAASS